MNRPRLAVVFASVVALAGCKSIDQLVAGGQYDAAIERAVAKRRPPSGKHARAWAVALVETNRFDEARGVLLADYQRGGDLTSLLALADLEVNRGLQGTAAVHYSTIAELDISRLAGRKDACALLRRRADAFAQGGAGQAAAQDLSRAADACGRPTDTRGQRRLLELETRVHAAARAEVEVGVQATVCRTAGQDLDLPDSAPRSAGPGPNERDPHGLCDADVALDHAALAEMVTRAATEGVATQRAAALREVATTYRLSLAPTQVVMLLEADMFGALGPAIIGDEEVRRWVGDAQWSDFAPLVAAQAKGPAAYAQLRLQAVLADLPLPPTARRRAPQRAVWAAQATDGAGRDAWRIFAWLGELGATELALASAWRPRDSPSPTGAGAGAGGAAVLGDPALSSVTSQQRPPPRHWVARLAPSTDSLRVALTVARLRHARGRSDLAVALARYVVGRAVEAGVDDAVPLAAEHAAWHLAHGRFWQALAVADAAPRSLATVTSAASTGLLLSEALCGGPCRDDQDAALSVRVMGQAWHDATLAAAPNRAVSGPTAALPAVAPCPSVRERLAGGGALARLITARDSADPALPVALSGVVETDITLGCAAHDATLLWVPMAPSATAESLLELLAHEPRVPTPSTLETLTRLALLADRPSRAENFAVAAAGSALDAREVWRRIAAFADMTGHRDLELMALHETLLHTPRLHAPVVRETILAETLGDATRSWGVTQTPAGRETLGRHVAEQLHAAAPSQRWAARDVLMWRVAAEPWWSSAEGHADSRAQWRALIHDALLGGAPPSRHALGLARLGLAPQPEGISDFDATGLQLQAIAGTRSALPEATAALGEPARLEPLRLAIARHGEQWQTRWRTAIGLAVYGTARARAEALETLASMATPAQRGAIMEIVLTSPVALSPKLGAPLGGVSVSLITDEEVLFRLVSGLDLAPAWYAR